MAHSVVYGLDGLRDEEGGSQSQLGRTDSVAYQLTRFSPRFSATPAGDSRMMGFNKALRGLETQSWRHQRE